MYVDSLKKSLIPAIIEYEFPFILTRNVYKTGEVEMNRFGRHAEPTKTTDV